MTRFMPKSCLKISDTLVFGIPDEHLALALPVTDLCRMQPVTHSTFSGILAAGFPEHGSLSTDS